MVENKTEQNFFSRQVKVTSEELESCQQWAIPTIDGYGNIVSTGSVEDIETQLTAEDLEKIRQQAYEEGLALGQEEGQRQGLQQGLQKAQEQANELKNIIKQSHQPLTEQREQLSESMMMAVFQIAESLVNHELSLNPEQVVDIVNQVLEDIYAKGERITVKISPGLLSKIQEQLTDENLEWQAEEGLTGFDIKIHREKGWVDHSLSKRFCLLVDKLCKGAYQPGNLAKMFENKKEAMLESDMIEPESEEKSSGNLKDQTDHQENMDESQP